MKMLLCTDTCLGVDYPDNLDVKRLRKWQKARFDAFSDLIDIAVQKHASYIALFGDTLGKDRVPERVIDELFKIVSEEPSVALLVFVFTTEYDRFKYRNDIPANLHLIPIEKKGTYLDDNVAVRVDGKIKIQLDDNDALEVFPDKDGIYYIKNPAEDSLKRLLSFEPIGFDDAASNRYGYSIIEWQSEKIAGYSEVDRQTYKYETVDIKILSEDDQKTILKKVVMATREKDFNTFLRVTIHGKLAFGAVVGCEAIRDQLHNKLFYAEVFDNTVMDLDVSEFDNDISLRSEFVRLALTDDTLSETERTKLIRCGWNVLNGKGVSVE